MGAIRSKELEFGANGKLSGLNSAGLLAETRGRMEKRDNHGWKSRNNIHSRSKSRPSTNRNNKNCFKCGKEGHWKRECPERWEKRNETANVVARIQEPMVLTASMHETRKEWVMDSGCSFHITHDRENLFDLEEFEGGRVLMGNDTFSEIKGIGKVKILNPDDSVVILTGVRYMPSMRRNLISYGQLEKNGCKYEGGSFKVTFYKNGRKVISGKHQDGLYHLEGKIAQGYCLFSSVNEEKKTHMKKKVSFKEDLIWDSNRAESSKQGELKQILTKKISEKRNEKSDSTVLKNSEILKIEESKSVKEYESSELEFSQDHLEVFSNSASVLSLLKDSMIENWTKEGSGEIGEDPPCILKRSFLGCCIEKCWSLLKFHA